MRTCNSAEPNELLRLVSTNEKVGYLYISKLACEHQFEGWLSKLACEHQLEGWLSKLACEHQLEGWLSKLACEH